ncbi:unnamed protein product [Timema podura]|uniref:Peptidase S1 domain-containing protein n=1 Tax=Timema podura TaxID=61482 RepID=A0ABN7NUZ9_TIMPD|nr:unnamed protein product [Timema podura]
MYLLVFLYMLHTSAANSELIATKVSIEDYPFMMTILEKGDFLCSGSIIGVRYALTAESCFLEREQNNKSTCGLYTRVGSSSFQSGGTKHDIAGVIYYPQMNSSTLQMIYRCHQDFELGESVMPVPLQSQDDEVAPGTLAYSLGWGSNNGNTTSSDFLMRGDYHILDTNEETLNSYEEQNIFAARSNHQIECGDKGGPLVANGVLIGVITFNSCPTGPMPATFLKVSLFSDWMKSIMESYSGNKTLKIYSRVS